VDATAQTSDQWVSNTGFSLGGSSVLNVTTINVPKTGMPKFSVNILNSKACGGITGDFATKNIAIPGGGFYDTGVNFTKTAYFLKS
jgi:hypothetical protein